MGIDIPRTPISFNFGAQPFAFDVRAFNAALLGRFCIPALLPALPPLPRAVVAELCRASRTHTLTHTGLTLSPPPPPLLHPLWEEGERGAPPMAAVEGHCRRQQLPLPGQAPLATSPRGGAPAGGGGGASGDGSGSSGSGSGEASSSKEEYEKWRPLLPLLPPPRSPSHSSLFPPEACAALGLAHALHSRKIQLVLLRLVLFDGTACGSITHLRRLLLQARDGLAPAALKWGQDEGEGVLLEDLGLVEGSTGVTSWWPKPFLKRHS